MLVLVLAPIESVQRLPCSPRSIAGLEVERSPKAMAFHPLALSGQCRPYFDLYWNDTFVSSSITSGRTNLYDLPARGTSTRTGRIPATRRCRLKTSCYGAFICAAWFLRT